MLYDLYRYDNWYDLLFDNSRFTCECNLTDNAPMNTRLVKIHKGVDNLLKFRVFDSDRKRAKIDHLKISGTLINKENRERVLTVKGTLECTRGIFTVAIPEGQLVDIAAGFYDFVVTGEEDFIPSQAGEIVSTPFYTDATSNIRLEAEVTDSVEKAPIPTTEIIEWSSQSVEIEGVYTKLYYSHPIAANRLRNLKHGTHTFTVSAENYRGLFQARGSLEHIPPAASDREKYFPLNLTDYSEFARYGDVDENGKLQTFHGIDAWSIQSNVLWIIFYWVATDDAGVPHPSHLDPPELILDDNSVVENKLDRVQLRS